jgi:hypothetical protein
MAEGSTTSKRDGAAWLRLLEGCSAEQAARAVTDALASVISRPDPLSARIAFGKLNRAVRPAPLPEGTSVREVAHLLGDRHLDTDIVARVAFVVSLAERFGSREFADVLTTLYRTGSEREQVGILRALAFLPSPEDVVPLAREASRTNDVAVFSALACESSFPAAHLPDPAFEQLVLKALFIGVPLDRIMDVQTRVTPELQRMVADFGSERRAAGRPVPADVARLLEKPLPTDRSHS